MPMKEPPVWAWWGWEPLPFYLHYKKNAPGVHGCTDEELISWYSWIHDESTVRKAAETGINHIVTHFVKGFGPEHERHDMRLTAELVEKCHRHGISVFGYIQYGSIFKETFFDDIPDAGEWIQLNEDGSPVLWCSSTDRYMPCINSDGYTGYLKSMIRHGLLNTGLDGLHFDNFYSRPCYCRKCREEYSKAKNMELPSFSKFTGEPYSPEVVEWTNFRCDALNRYMKKLQDYAKSLKPDVMTIWNPSPIRGLLDQRTLRAADFYGLGRHAGFLWSESGNFPSAPNGLPIHQVNFFKTASAVGYRTFSTVWRSSTEGSGLPGDPGEIALLTAECAVFGAVPGTNWLMRPQFRKEFDNCGMMYQEFYRQINYYRSNAGLFTETLPDAEIALFFDREAAAGDFPGFYGVFLVLQQILLQKHFSFDIVFSGDEEKLSGYPCVVSVGHKDPAHSCVLHFDRNDTAGFTGGTYSAGITLSSEADAVAGQIRSALKERKLTVDAPEYVFIEKRRHADGRHLLHLVNYGNMNGPVNAEITFKDTPEGLRLFSPENTIELVCSKSHAAIRNLETWCTLVWEDKIC